MTKNIPKTRSDKKLRQALHLTMEEIHADCNSLCNLENIHEVLMKQAVQIAAYFAAWVNFLQTLSHEVGHTMSLCSKPQNAAHFPPGSISCKCWDSDRRNC